MTSVIADYFEKHIQILASVGQTLEPAINECAALVLDALGNGNKVLVMGNGGSAADAQHFVSELVGRFRRERKGLPAIALTTDTSALTAISNDYGFDHVFSRQVEALAEAGDVVFGLSTSGNSRNVLVALRTAKDLGCRTVGLLGKGGGEIAGEVDLPIVVQARETSHIQEAHIVVIHVLCELIESSCA